MDKGTAGLIVMTVVAAIAFIALVNLIILRIQVAIHFFRVRSGRVGTVPDEPPADDEDWQDIL